MATATSSAFTLQEETGRDVVTLTSYAGPITWTTTPVSGDQIEYPTSVTVAVDGTITGAAGTYTIRHIVASTGAIQSISHVLSSSASASATVNLDTDTGGNFDYVTLTSYSGPMTWATTPVAGDQIIFPSNCSIGADGSFTGPNDTFTLWHIVASTGASESIDYVNSGSNTAPTFGGVTDKTVNVGDLESFSIAASDPDVGDTLTYSVDTLPTNLQLVGSTVSTIDGNGYTVEQTIKSTFGVDDGAGGTDSLEVLFSVARAGYTITTMTVDHAGLNPDSPLIAAITDQDLAIGDQVDYPVTATDHVGTTRAISFASDGLMTVAGSRSIKIDNIHMRDSSAGYARSSAFSVTLVGTGPSLTSPLEVVPNTATTSGGDVRFTTDEGSEVTGADGFYRLIAVPANSGTPTPSQVYDDGTNASGGAALFDTGNAPYSAQAQGVEEVVSITGLPTSGAGYWIFLALKDQYGGTTLSGPVTLTTTATGAPPVWSAIPDQNFTEGTEFSLDLSAYVSDFVSFSIAGLAQESLLSFNTSTGVLSGTPDTTDASGALGSTTPRDITVTAINGTGPSVQTFTANFYRLDPPVAGTLANQSWQEGQAINFGLGTAITGATSYELQIDNAGWFDGTSELWNYKLTFTSATGVLSGTIASMAINSPYSMRARGVNADGNSAWIYFTVIVNSATGAGFFGPIPDQTFSEGNAGSVNFSAYFTGAESYTISGLPANTNLSIDSNTGVFSGTPNTYDSAAAPLALIVTAVNADGNASGAVNVTITSLNPPVLTAAFPNVVYAVGDTFTIVPGNNFTGEDSITVLGLPTNSGLSFDGTTFTGTLRSADKLASPYPVTIRAVNTDGNRDDTFLIEVTGAQFIDGTIITPAIRTMILSDRRSLSPKVYLQDTVDRIDYAVDLSAWLGTDTIASATVASGDDLVVEGIKSSTAIQMFLTGGTLGVANRITARVTTTEGRILDTSFYVTFVDM